MKVALFGGTFDPVHRGHLAVARAARDHFRLDRVFFVPADIPPHKQRLPVSSFYDRYAMVALATAGEKAFIPALLEAPGQQPSGTPSYSLNTVRRFRSTLPRSARLFFLIGIDSFLEIATWHKAEELLQEVEFIIASRPGFSLKALASALPKGLRPPERVRRISRGLPAHGDVAVGGVLLHLLPSVKEDVSATQLRAAAGRGRSLKKMVPDAVAEYIRKTHLYREPVIAAAAGRTAGARSRNRNRS
jgi:nicotinate-nucleotide adenylyltransferase